MIAVYQAHFNSSGALDEITPVSDFAPSSDYYQSDRSHIDSEVTAVNEKPAEYSNATDPYRTGGGEYFVVVKNEQGSLGRYSISVDAPAFQPLSANPSTNLYVSAVTGSARACG